MNNEKMSVINVRISDEQKNDIETLALQEEITTSQIIRNLLNIGINKYKGSEIENNRIIIKNIIIDIQKEISRLELEYIRCLLNDKNSLSDMKRLNKELKEVRERQFDYFSKLSETYE